jgi:hypothetical protein
LVGYWTFDGPDISGTRAKDRSGNNNHGTITGAVPVAGRVGQALDFDGSDDKINAGTTNDSVLLENQQVTIAAWIYPKGQQSLPGQIVHRQNGSLGPGLYIYTDNTFTFSAVTNGENHVYRITSAIPLNTTLSG